MRAELLVLLVPLCDGGGYPVTCVKRWLVGISVLGWLAASCLRAFFCCLCTSEPLPVRVTLWL